MPRVAPISLLVLLTTLIGACGTTPMRRGAQLPEQRPSDFTLGLVVYGVDDDDSVSTAQWSARYIIEPDGVLRSSFGDGSKALTFPPITRRLNESRLDSIWASVRQMGLNDEPWRWVQAPETHHKALGSAKGYLLELRSGVRFQAWSAPIDTDSAQSLAETLAGLCWVGD